MGKLLSVVIPIQSCTHISEKVNPRRFSETQIKPQPVRPQNQNPQTINPKLPTKLSSLMDNKPRTKLSEVVSDCVGRWFQDALKEARNGDLTMQAVVGQMYFNGYGVAKSEKQEDARKEFAEDALHFISHNLIGPNGVECRY